MVRFARVLLLAILALMLVAPAAAAAPSTGRYIVTARAGVDAAALAKSHGAKADVVYRTALNGFAGALSRAQVARLRADSRVAAVEADGIMTTLDDGVPTGIDRIDAEATTSTNGTGPDLNVNVAVIDTGIAAHPDLRILPGADFSRTLFFCRSQSTNDGNGHGTHVAGTIGAKDNGSGVVGVAPGAGLIPVKVLTDSGSGYTSCVIRGVDWVASNAASRGIKVANMSVGGATSSALCSAISNAVSKGVFFAVAAGNSNADAATSGPANCSATNGGVVTVSAIADYNGKGGGGAAASCTNYGADDSLATFSNYATPGSSVVMIAAPGVCINSTYKAGAYAVFNGTSMAAPHVAGAAAVYRLANASATPATTRAGLLAAAKPDTDPSCGYTHDPAKIGGPVLYVANPATSCG